MLIQKLSTFLLQSPSKNVNDIVLQDESVIWEKRKPNRESHLACATDVYVAVLWRSMVDFSMTTKDIIEVYNRKDGSIVLSLQGKYFPAIDGCLQISHDRLAFRGSLGTNLRFPDLKIFDLKSGKEILSVKKDLRFQETYPSNFILEKTRILLFCHSQIYSAEFWI
jgi:hypothetical protein